MLSLESASGKEVLCALSIRPSSPQDPVQHEHPIWSTGRRRFRNIPERIEPGVLYISMDFATAVHRCCCGCEEKVVTPFTPTDWKMTFDGETISLRPSVGNWNIPCRSHYVIDRSRVIEARPWTDWQIANERGRDKEVKAQFYGEHSAVEDEERPAIRDKEPASVWWPRIKRCSEGRQKGSAVAIQLFETRLVP
jgi:hypothetical protein